MVSLKAVRGRIKSISNIQKITDSLKMVASTKFARAETRLTILKGLENSTMLLTSELNNTVRSYTTSNKVNENNDENLKYNGIALKKPSEYGAIMMLTSDKGMCGQIHSNVVKYMKNINDLDPSFSKLPIITVGDRIASLAEKLPNKKVMHFSGIGKQFPTFNDAKYIIQSIKKVSDENENFKIPLMLLIYNRFRNRMSFDTLHTDLLGPSFPADDVTSCYEIDSTEIVNSFCSLTPIFQLYSAMGVSACAELSTRRNSMENSTKNASDMLKDLKLTYNRTRQAKITNELNEIVAGASVK